MNDITDLSALELRGKIADGTVSAEEATQAYLDHISATETSISAFNELHTERALERARAIDSKARTNVNLGPLAGIPVAIKDVLCTDYGRTTCSSKILANFRAPYTATAVHKLEAAGAVVLGKTNMDEFAMGSSTENSGFGPTRNPWNTERVPGGSSGGSAAAVAAKQCAAALGSDTGGSVRQPAAFCGVVGFKPTYGRVSRFGLVAYGSSLDQVGPLTRDVMDAALVMQAMAGHDPKDSTSLPDEVPDFMHGVDQSIKKLRIGLPKEFYSDALDDEIRDALNKAAECLREAGSQIVDVTLPHSRIDHDAEGNLSSYAVACYYIVAMAEASSNLARYDGVHYGHRTKLDVDNIVDLYSKSRAEGLGQEVKRRIMLGTYTLSAGYYDAYYNKALKVRRLIKNDFDEAFKNCDVILAPVSPTTAFKIGQKTSDPLEMYLADIYTISVNLAGLPGLSLPIGLSKDNLPIGMQLIGPALSDLAVLRIGRMYEKISGITRLNTTVEC